MTIEKALDLVAIIVAAFPNWNPPEPTQRLYAKYLMPLAADMAEGAILEMIAELRQFAPTIGEVLARIAACRLAIEGRGTVSAEEAWSLTQNAIRHVGFYQYPGNLPPRVQRAINAIGWRELCSNENVVANRAHFMRIFNAIQEREAKDEVEKLVGTDLGWALPAASAPPRRVETALRPALRALSETTAAPAKPLAPDLQQLLDRMRTKAAGRKAPA